MKTLLKYALAVILVGSSVMSGCAGIKRSKWSDKTMRVMINPEGIGAGHLVRIQQALVQSGKWVVIDRGMGYHAIQKEQEREHREQTDRFMDREKFAHWGKLYGVGGVVVAHAQCSYKRNWFTGNTYPYCQQYLAIIDTNTAEVISAVEDDSEGSAYETDIAPSWDDIVAKLNNAFPARFQPSKEEKTLTDYKDLSQEEATRQKEVLARQLAEEKDPK